MSKLTSVEWLQKEFNYPESFLTEEDFEKAKEMHKREIEKAKENTFTEGQVMVAMSKAREQIKLLEYKYGFYEIIQSLKQPK